MDVLQCRFHYYSSNMKPTDQRMTAIERIVCYSLSSRGGRPGHAGSHREAPGGRKRQGNTGRRFDYGFHRKARQGK